MGNLIPLPPKKYILQPATAFIKNGILKEQLWSAKIENNGRSVKAAISFDNTDPEAKCLYILITEDEETRRKEIFYKKEFPELWERLKSFSAHGDNDKLPPII